MNEEEKEFWEKLKRWHLDDVDICIGNNANYAASKMMLTLIDILGAFHGGMIRYKSKYYVLPGGKRKQKSKTIKIEGKNYEQTTNKEQFLSFLKNYIHEFYEIKVKHGSKEKRAAEILYDHFRCGLVHEGHSKLGTGLARINNAEPIINKDGLLVLNILALRDLVRRATFKFEKDLNKEKMLKRWRERYNFLTKEFRF
ncbi:hypothetical protein HZB93_03285 [Candidatus Falkowbacteria bacterium]|nr:hypothetical protein [Candidatus Falkowbacteria bacterium]